MFVERGRCRLIDPAQVIHVSTCRCVSAVISRVAGWGASNMASIAVCNSAAKCFFSPVVGGHWL